MNITLNTVVVRFEHDVVLARQRARQIAGLLGFDNRDQVRIATAVSEIVRNAFRYAGGGKAEFTAADDGQPKLQIRISDQGCGIRNLSEVLAGRYESRTGMGMGIMGAKRLMDEFEISSDARGTEIRMGKVLASLPRPFTKEELQLVVSKLAQFAPQDPFEEVQRQNQELMVALEELQRRQTELGELNKELQDTNRGVVALYAELDERADYLRRASEIKTQFLSNMTHEFRTPVNSIMSLSRILLDRIDGELNTEQQRQVKFIQRAAQDLSEIVNDLLDLAKVEAGKITIQPAEFLIQDLFGALRGMLRPMLAGNSSVNLVFDGPENVPVLNTDESKVSQILRNLISNALKFTERGEVRISARWEQDWVAISVSDTGIGIALADQERIFEEFTQVPGAHQKGKTGTGLGLPLSRKLAQLLGGGLTVQSEAGLGSTFILRIPPTYKGAREVSFVPELATEPDSLRALTQELLIIDDDEASRYVLVGLLENSSFRCTEAESGQEGMKLARQQRPAAIFLDVLMPDMNGLDVLRSLKLDAATKDIPVIIHTAKTLTSQERAQILECGASFMDKNHADRRASLERLQKILPRFQPPDRTERKSEIIYAKG